MTLHVFGETITINLDGHHGKLEVLADPRVAQILIDAHDIQEPIDVDGQACLITHMEDWDLHEIYTDLNMHLLEMVLEAVEN